MMTRENLFSQPPSAPVEHDPSKQYNKNINSDEYEFKILVWSIATAIFYSSETVQNQGKYKSVAEISRYMLYLLVKQPMLISAEVGLMGVGFERIIHLDMEARNSDDDPVEVCSQLLEACRRSRGEEDDNTTIVLRKAIVYASELIAGVITNPFYFISINFSSYKLVKSFFNRTLKNGRN